MITEEEQFESLREELRKLQIMGDITFEKISDQVVPEGVKYYIKTNPSSINTDCFYFKDIETLHLFVKLQKMKISKLYEPYRLMGVDFAKFAFSGKGIWGEKFYLLNEDVLNVNGFIPQIIKTFDSLEEFEKYWNNKAFW